MYPITEEVLSAINDIYRDTSVSGTITSLDGTVIDIDRSNITSGDRSVTILQQCLSSGDFNLGAVNTAELTMSIIVDNQDTVLDGASIVLNFFVQLHDGEWFEIPLGAYTITEAKRSPPQITIRAFDNMILLDEPLNNVGTSGTLYALTLYCCERCGVTFGMTENNFMLLPNTQLHFIVPSDSPIETCRDLVSYIAQLVGGFATINREGELVYKLLVPQRETTLQGANRTGTTYDDYTIQYSGVQMDVGDSTYIRVDSESEGGTLILESNPLVQGRDVDSINIILDNILSAITPIRYTPYKTSYTGNPAIDVGDFVTLEGGIIKAPLLSLVSVSEWRYRGMQRLEGQGTNPKLKVKESQSTKRLNQTSALAQASRETVYYFENASKETIKEREEVIIEIQFAAVKKASPMFHATVQLELEMAGSVLFRYIIDNTPFDFSPLFQLPLGVSTLQLFYPLNGMVENKLHTFEVCISSTDTTGFIPKKCIQAVVVGQGLGSGEAMWDGRIRVSEEAVPFGLGATISMQFAGAVEVATETPIPNGFAVTMPANGLGRSIVFGGFTESISTAYVVENALFYFDSAHKADHIYSDDYYIEDTAADIHVRENYPFVAEGMPIDSGYLQTLVVDETKLDTITAIVLEVK